MTANAKARPRLSGDRGSNAERSAAMRKRLLDAAIRSLCRVGYAATTTQFVTEQAGVSRGAMLHHFPTKLDLVIAVGEYAAEAHNRCVRRALAKIPAGIDRFLALTDATWQSVREPPTLALMEILIASRSEPGLSERFPPVVRALEARQLQDVVDMAAQIGIRDGLAIEQMVRLHRATMRGLMLEQLFNGDESAAASSMELLNWYKRRLTGALATRREQLLSSATNDDNQGEVDRIWNDR